MLCGKCSQIPIKDSDSRSQTSPTSVNGTLTGNKVIKKLNHDLLFVLSDLFVNDFNLKYGNSLYINFWIYLQRIIKNRKK